MRNLIRLVNIHCTKSTNVNLAKTHMAASTLLKAVIFFLGGGGTFKYFGKCAIFLLFIFLNSYFLFVCGCGGGEARAS